ncbi:hypothetical protein FRC12_000408 [Ceratobasidium sp. 428]|nr:hypothetical protein FRC12_000408 [Ceratobasidium sp. 428]
MADLLTRSLIPATCAWRGKSQIHASISQTLTPENMARFHFYAPFIKTFWLSSCQVLLEAEDWHTLTTYSQKTKLLPNLITFTCWKPDPQAFSVFLSDSTRIIHSGQHYTSLAGGVLARIASGSPAIHELKLYPTPDEEVAHSAIEDIAQQMFAPMSEFRQLRTLTTGTAMLQPCALQLISRLPNLVELRIEPVWPNRSARFNSPLSHALPEDAFPSLRALRVAFDTSQDVKRFWDLIPLKALTEVYIMVRLASSNNQAPFIPSLCRGSPQIRGLHLEFPAVESDGGDSNEAIYGIQADMFEYLGKLPLDRFLSLTFAKFDFENAWNGIAVAWPCIGEIRFPHQPARIEHLMTLSTNLPNLTIVECDFDLAHMVSVVEHNWQPIGDLTRYPKLKQLTIQSGKLKELAYNKYHRLYDSARFLGYFWPNVDVSTSITDEDPDLETGYDEWIYEAGLFNMLTNLIKSHARSFRDF